MSDIYAMGGVVKVLEAGGVLCGGHSISDEKTMYGLSVTGIVMAAYSAFHEADETFAAAVASMETLNKKAAEAAKDFYVSACTDITGFGFAVRLDEPEPAMSILKDKVEFAVLYRLSGRERIRWLSGYNKFSVLFAMLIYIFVNFYSDTGYRTVSTSDHRQGVNKRV